MMTEENKLNLNLNLKLIIIMGIILYKTLNLSLPNKTFYFSLVILLTYNFYRDLDTRKIPRHLTYIVFFIGLGTSIYLNNYSAILVMILVFGKLFVLRKFRILKMGLSDIFFISISILYLFPLGTWYIGSYLTISFGTLNLYALIEKENDSLPFYPFLLIGFLSTILLLQEKVLFESLIISLSLMAYMFAEDRYIQNFEYKRYLILLFTLINISGIGGF